MGHDWCFSKCWFCITVKASNEAARTTVVSGQGASPNYSWTFSGPGTLSFTQNVKDITSISADTQGTYTVTLTVTNTTNSAVGSDDLILLGTLLLLQLLILIQQEISQEFTFRS